MLKYGNIVGTTTVFCSISVSSDYEKITYILLAHIALFSVTGTYYYL